MRKRVYCSIETVAHSNQEENQNDIARPPTAIHNLVGTTELWCTSKTIDLKHINMLPCTFYDKNRFAAITIRIAEPNCTALLFTSGKLVLTGATSWIQCLHASLFISKLLSKVCKHDLFRVVKTQVQNIVGNAIIPLKKGQILDLKRLYDERNTTCTWQPNMFPGLVMREDNCPVVLLLFLSGRVVITGGKKEEDIENGWKMLWPIIKQYITTESNTFAITPLKKRRRNLV